MDEDLRRDLRRVVDPWSAPAPSAALDARMLQEFRRRRSWWQRAWRARIVLPVPILAASLAVAAAGAWLSWSAFHRPASGGWEPVAEPKLQVVRTVGTP